MIYLSTYFFHKCAKRFASAASVFTRPVISLSAVYVWACKKILSDFCVSTGNNQKTVQKNKKNKKQNKNQKTPKTKQTPHLVSNKANIAASLQVAIRFESRSGDKIFLFNLKNWSHFYLIILIIPTFSIPHFQVLQQTWQPIISGNFLGIPKTMIRGGEC